MVKYPVAPVYFKLNELRAEEKYSDINIIVGEKTFKCHRIVLAGASSFFDSMFCGSFMESSTKECHLNDVDGELFEEVLQIIYSGELEITKVNVFDLLRISEFLSMPKIREPCIKYILENMLLIEDVIEIFVWARAMDISRLADALGLYISNEIVRFSASDAFVQMSFDDLYAVLVLRSDLTYSRTLLHPIKLDDFIMDAIIRWIHFSYIERRNYIEEFINMISCMELSAEYSKFAMRRYELDLTVPEKRVVVLKTHFVSPDDGRFPSHNALPISFSDHEFLTKNLSINLFIGREIFSINKYRPDGFISHKRECSIGSRLIRLIQPSCKFDSLYCVNDWGEWSTSFNAYSSLDLSMSSSRALCPPPVADIVAGTIDEKSDNIYYLSYFKSGHSSYIRNRLYSPDRKLFSDEEIAVGMFYYNCQLDEWFSATQMKAFRYAHPRLLSDNNIVYMINENGLILAYDTRSAQPKLYQPPDWLTSFDSWHSSDWCIFDGNIYAVDDTKIKILNLTAGKWETITLNPNIIASEMQETNYSFSICRNRVVAYDGMLWLFHNQFVESDFNLSMRIFNPRTRALEFPHYALRGDTVLTKCDAKKSALSNVVVFKC